MCIRDRFGVVFLIGLEVGMLPHNRAKTPVQVEEERRLLYVGVTRAKDELYFTQALERAGRYPREYIPTPFLNKVRGDYIERIYLDIEDEEGSAAPAEGTVIHEIHGRGIITNRSDDTAMVMFESGIREVLLSELTLVEADYSLVSGE